MKRLTIFMGIVALAACVLGVFVIAGYVQAKPDKVDGVNVPFGRVPQEIKDISQ